MSTQALATVQPRETAFDDPPVLSQSGTVSSSAAPDARGDAVVTQQSPVVVVGIATVGEHLPGIVSGPAPHMGAIHRGRCRPSAPAARSSSSSSS